MLRHSAHVLLTALLAVPAAAHAGPVPDARTRLTQVIVARTDDGVRVTIRGTGPIVPTLVAAVGRLPPRIVIDLVDVTPGETQQPEQIVARVERALQRIEAKRITLNPDCGFAPGSAARVDIDEVYLKLRAESEAARLLRARHG